MSSNIKNVVVKRLTLLLLIWEVQGSKLGLQTSNPDRDFLNPSMEMLG
jgi:hypothetical protein